MTEAQKQQQDDKHAKELTPKQLKFAQCVADGMTQADAYRSAYKVSAHSKPETCQENASRLMADSRVSARVAQIRGTLAAKALWTRERSVAALKDAIDIAKEQGQSGGLTGAVKELNAMHGYNAPVKHIVDLNQLTPIPDDDWL